MSQTVTERTAEHIGESVREASCATATIADAIEDGLGAVRSAVKKSGAAADEFLDDTTQRLQRHLTLTIATTFLAGVTTGTWLGWMMKRR